MPTPLLSASDLADLRAVLVAGLAIDGVGVGGDAWVVETTTGDGVSTPIVPADGATITGYLYQVRVGRTQLAPTAPGALAGTAIWQFAVTSGAASVGAVVRSVSDGRRVRLQADMPDPLYPTFLAEVES